MEYRQELELVAFDICVWRSARAWEVLRPLRKPYCTGDRWLFDSRYQKRRMLSIFWNNLPNTLVRAIGRYEAGAVGSVFGFRKGKMMAIFHVGG